MTRVGTPQSFVQCFTWKLRKTKKGRRTTDEKFGNVPSKCSERWGPFYFFVSVLQKYWIIVLLCHDFDSGFDTHPKWAPNIIKYYTNYYRE